MLRYFWILLLLALPSNGLHCCTKEPCMLEVLGEVVECQSSCFLRTSARGGVVQRGCYDSWLGSPVDYSYEGCRMQQYLGENVEWCFCRNLGKGGSLCNAHTREELHRSVYEKPFAVDPDKTSNEVSRNTQIPALNEVVIAKPRAPERRTPLVLTESGTSGHVIDVRGYATQGGARSVNHSPESRRSSWAPYGPSQKATQKTSGHVVDVKGYARHDGVAAKARSSKQSTRAAYGTSLAKSAPEYQSSSQIIDIRGHARRPGIRQPKQAQRFQESRSPAPYGPSIIAPNLSQNQPWNAKTSVSAQPRPNDSKNQIENLSSWTAYNRRVDEPTDHSTEVVDIRGPARHTPQPSKPKSKSNEQSLYNRRVAARTAQAIQAIGVTAAKPVLRLEPRVQPQPRVYGPPLASYSQPPSYTQPSVLTQPPMPSYIKPHQGQRPTKPVPPKRSYSQNQGYSNSRPSTVSQSRSQPIAKSSRYNPAKAAFMAFKATAPPNPQPKHQTFYTSPQSRLAYSSSNQGVYSQQQPSRQSKRIGLRDVKSGSGQVVRPGDAKRGPRTLHAPKKQNQAKPQLKPFQFKAPQPITHRQYHNNAIGTPEQRSPYTVPSGRTINYRHPNAINPLPTLNHPAAHMRSSRAYKPPLSLLKPPGPGARALVPLSRPPVVVAKPPPPPRPPRTYHHVARHLPSVNPQHNQVTPLKRGSPKTGKYGGLECFACHDSSPHCGHTVSNPKRVSTTQCKTKCFLKMDTNGKIYRGCFDGWVTSSFTSDYNGCQAQIVGQYKPTWCFCDGNLCNGAAFAALGGKSLPGPSPPQHNLSPIIPYMSPLSRQSSPAPQQNVYVPKNYHGLLHVPKSHQVQAKFPRRQQQKKQDGKNVDKLLSMFTELCKKSGVIRRQGTSHWACDIPLPK